MYVYSFYVVTVFGNIILKLTINSVSTVSYIFVLNSCFDSCIIQT